MNLADLTASQLAAGYQAHDFTPVDVIESVLARATVAQDSLNCFVTIDEAGARKSAEASAARWKSRTAIGPLDGVPISIKDLILTAGMPTFYGSLTTEENQQWDEDAPVVAHLRRAGAVIFGKTTTPEFGHKGVTESLQHGITRNPWKLDMTPGGSSGGAAAAVAIGAGPIAIGTDGGGSIRQPANFCGIVGFKPSATAVPIWPNVASWPLSVVGPMARTVEDVTTTFRAIAKPEDRDPWAGRPLPDQPFESLKTASLRIAVAHVLDGNVARAAVREHVDRVAAVFETLGATATLAEPETSMALPIHRTMWDVGSAYTMASIPEERRGLLEETYIGSAMRGEAISQVEFRKALDDRLVFQKLLAEFFRSFDLLVLPVNPYQAFPVERLEPDRGPDDAWKSGIAYTCPFNVSGNPALSFPVGFSNGLPIGVQLVGPMWSDYRLLAIASLLEKSLVSQPGLAPLPD